MTVTEGPVAGRLQRPTWKDPRLLIGLAMIAVAIIGVSSVVRSADVTEPHYVARHTLTPGTVVTESNVAIVDVRVSGGTYVPLGDLEWGSVVTRVVSEGELLPASALASPQDFEARPVAVHTSMPVAATIDAGAVVDVWLTVTDDDGPSSRLIAAGLDVAAVDRETGAFAVGGSETVYVVVPTDMMAEFLEALSTPGDISVVGLAGDGL